MGYGYWRLFLTPIISGGIFAPYLYCYFLVTAQFVGVFCDLFVGGSGDKFYLGKPYAHWSGNGFAPFEINHVSSSELENLPQSG